MQGLKKYDMIDSLGDNGILNFFLILINKIKNTLLMIHQMNCHRLLRLKIYHKMSTTTFADMGFFIPLQKWDLISLKFKFFFQNYYLEYWKNKKYYQNLS